MATKAPFYLAGTTPIWRREDNSHLAIGGSDIDGDGIGGRVDGDKYWQPQTSYRPSINSKLVRGFVVPEKYALSFPEKVIGCKARVTLIQKGLRLDFFVHDIGPDEKFGEMTIKGAEDFAACGSSPTNGGTIEPLFLYEWWPGVPGLVDGVPYLLQSLVK